MIIRTIYETMLDVEYNGIQVRYFEGDLVMVKTKDEKIFKGRIKNITEYRITLVSDNIIIEIYISDIKEIE